MTEPNRTASVDIPPPVAMLQMIAGFWVSRALYIAAKLGLADLLKEGPQSSEELAQATRTHTPSLYRVLRALASVGVFTEDDGRRFALTPLGATLQADAPGSLRAFALLELGEEAYPAWGAVLHSVQTGQTAFNHVFGMDEWEYSAQYPEAAKTFDEAMANITAVVSAAVLGSYDFAPLGTIVDVGGGDGSLLVSLLKAYPRLKGILFDLPHAVARARQRIERKGLTERCEVVTGDFFASVPRGGDAYILKWIIHDWDDERSVAILKNCHRAMAEHSKLLLIEARIPPGNAPSFTKFMDLLMLVMAGGRERTEAEYQALLEAAGFRMTKVIPTQAAEMDVIEAVRA